MDALLSGRIAVVIAHRLSTIRNADRILIIEHGGIAEQGSHEELMAIQGRYYKLYIQQGLSEFILNTPGNLKMREQLNR